MTHLFDSDIIVSHLNKKREFSIILSTPPAMSVITYGELLYGVEKSKSPAKRSQLEGLLRDLQMVILPVTQAIIKRFTLVKLQLERAGKKLDEFDLLIATTALEHNLTLVTDNKKHFGRIPGLSLA